MYECNICFENKTCSSFLKLSCCKNNYLCVSCATKLQKPQCPFCLSEMNQIGRRRTRSASISETPISFMDVHIESFDDITYYSKIYRKKRSRMLKLREREQDNIENLYWERKKKKQSRQRRKSEIRREILEINS